VFREEKEEEEEPVTVAKEEEGRLASQIESIVSTRSESESAQR